MINREERTIIEEILDNKRAVEKLEQGYHYDDVKFALVVVGIVVAVLVIGHFIITGTLA